MTRVTNSYLHNTFNEKAYCLPGAITATTSRRFQIQRFPAMIIGDTEVIDQHVTEVSCIKHHWF